MRRMVRLWLVVWGSACACNKGESELRSKVEQQCRLLEEDLTGMAGDYHKWIAAGHSDEPPRSLWVHPPTGRGIEGIYLNRELKFCIHVRATDQASDNRVSTIFDVATDRYGSAQSPVDVVAEVDVMLIELKKLNALPLRD